MIQYCNFHTIVFQDEFLTLYLICHLIAFASPLPDVWLQLPYLERHVFQISVSRRLLLNQSYIAHSILLNDRPLGIALWINVYLFVRMPCAIDFGSRDPNILTPIGISDLSCPSGIHQTWNGTDILSVGLKLVIISTPISRCFVPDPYCICSAFRRY